MVKHMLGLYKGVNMKIRIVSIILCLLPIFISNCDNDESEFKDKFSIYISDSTYNYEDISLETIQKNDTPFITLDKITSYNWSTHEIIYSSGVWEELKEWGNLLHKYFIVIVNDERIYWGIFMDDLDSGGCQNPVIKLLPRYPDGRNTIPESLIIDRAYPEYVGSEDDPDLREDTRIYDILLESGKFAE